MKSQDDRRKQHKIGFSAKEWAIICKLAKCHHMNPSEFIRLFVVKYCNLCIDASSSAEMRKALFNAGALLHSIIICEGHMEDGTGTDTPET